MGEMISLLLLGVCVVCVCDVLQKGLKNVFDEAILAALDPPQLKKPRKCVLL